MINSRYFFAPGKGGWNYFSSRWNPRRPLVLLLDYDGTLTPIRREPSLAVLSPPVKKLLQELAGRPLIAAGLITGRGLEDIKKMAGLPSLFYAANHGFQIWFNRRRWIHPGVQALKPLLSQIHLQLQEALAPFRGVWVENKIFTLSIHYRLARGDLIPQAKKTVGEIMRPFASRLRLTSGKKVWEIRPAIPWDKGRAALYILDSIKIGKNPLIFYLGDDRTDEDAFRALRRKAVTIKVGRSLTTQARYFVKNVEEVHKLLEQIGRLGAP